MPTKPLIIMSDPQQGHQICDFLYQTAKVLAKQYQVIIIKEAEPLSLSDLVLTRFKAKPRSKTQPDNITVINPLFLIPFTRFSFITTLNYYLFDFLFQLKLLLAGKKAIFWFFFPISHRFVLPWFYVLFDCVDIHPEHSKLPAKGGQTSKLLDRANSITSIADTQIAFLKTLTNKPITKTLQGFTVPTTTLKRKRKPAGAPPIFGFVGAISDRFNFSLLYSFVSNNPQWLFEFWGPLTAYYTSQEALEKKVAKLAKLPNASFKGSVNKQDIPKILTRFDVGIIPYDVTQILNKYSYPMKLYDYYFAGIPVLSTPIEELAQDHHYVYTGSTFKDWQQQAEIILSTRWNTQNKKRQKQLALSNNWRKKVANIIRVIQSHSLE